MFTPAALRELERHPWNGNLNELKQCVELGISRTTTHLIDVGHLFDIRDTDDAYMEEADPIGRWKDELNRFQRNLIHRAMDRCDHNVAQAASLLGISRQYLNNRLKVLELEELRRNAPKPLS